jgi:enoyl-[acyl-carrier protein] reductase II
MPSGQGIGGIGDVLPAAEIVRRVLSEAEETIGRLGALR